MVYCAVTSLHLHPPLRHLGRIRKGQSERMKGAGDGGGPVAAMLRPRFADSFSTHSAAKDSLRALALLTWLVALERWHSRLQLRGRVVGG